MKKRVLAIVVAALVLLVAWWLWRAKSSPTPTDDRAATVAGSPRPSAQPPATEPAKPVPAKIAQMVGKKAAETELRLPDGKIVRAWVLNPNVPRGGTMQMRAYIENGKGVPEEAQYNTEVRLVGDVTIPYVPSGYFVYQKDQPGMYELSITVPAEWSRVRAIISAASDPHQDVSDRTGRVEANIDLVLE